MDWEKLATYPSLWQEFISTKLRVPFKFNFYRLTFWQSLTTYDCGSRVQGAKYNGPCSYLNERWHSCNDSTISNRIIHALVYNQDVRIVCNGEAWSVNSSVLCVGCQSYDTQCPVLNKNYTIMPPVRDCDKTKYTPKLATVFSVGANIVVSSSVPIIDHINVTAGMTNISVSITSTCYPPGCKFSCMAFSSGMQLTSASSLLSSPFSTSFQTNRNFTGIFDVLINDGLIASKAYDVYCLAMDIAGNTASIRMLSKTKAVTRTLCCRVVGFLSAPRYLYLEGPNKLKNKPFRYQVTSLPEHDLNVSFRVTWLNGSDTDLQAFPSSASFTSTSSSLSGTFAFPLLSRSGSFLVKLDVGGKDKAIYEGGVSTFLALSSSSNPPAPVISSFIFDSNGASALATFDSATELVVPPMTSLWSCSTIFEFSGASASQCCWQSSSVIRVYFPAMSTYSLLEPGDQILLKNATVRAQCLYTITVCQSYAKNTPITLLSLASTDLPVVPTIVISVPRYMGVCDNFTFDAMSSYGDGGRPWKSFSISFSAYVASDLSAIQERLDEVQNIATTKVTIPGAFFNVSQVYSIGVSLTNYLGGTTFQEFKIQRNSTNLPFVGIMGASLRTISSSDTLSLTVYALPSTCGGSTPRLTYRWKVYKDLLYYPVQSKSADPRKMVLGAHTLPSGHFYRFSCVATDASGQSKEASTDITVVPGPISVVIKGGSLRSIPWDKSLTLDGSLSTDSELNPADSSNSLLFSWSCIYVSTSSLYGKFCDSGILSGLSTSESILTIPSKRLSYNETYQFNLEVARDSRGNTSSVIVSVSPSGAALVSVSDFTSKVNAGQKVVVLGSLTAETSIAASWKMFSEGQEISLPDKSLGITSIVIGSSDAQRSSTFALGVRPGALEAGRTYSFRLTGLTFGTLSSHSETVLTINSPPTTGSILVSPSSGDSTTTFTLSATNWVDDASDYPLLYQFAYSVRPLATAYFLGSYSEIASVSNSLPPGNSAYNHSLQTLVFVQDLLGAVANSAGQVVVTSLPVSMDARGAMSNLLLNSLSSFLSYGDFSGATMAINVASSILNIIDCSASVNCDDLHRSPCYSRANTCGPCLSGYSGVIGPSNSVCKVKKSKKKNFDHRVLAIYNAPSASCASDDDCEFGSCSSSGVCVDFLKICSSANLQECSGHGKCIFMSASGKAMSSNSCGVTNTYCHAVCACHTGYGKEDCSASTAEVDLVQNMRVSMCSTVSTAILTQDVTDNAILNFLGLLVNAFHPFEVVSDAGILECGKLLTTIGTKAVGYLNAAGAPEVFANAVSLFIETVKRQKAVYLYERSYSRWMNNSQSSKFYFGEMRNKLYSPSKKLFVEDAVQDLIDAVQTGMFPGEMDGSIVSSNVRLTLSYSRVDSFASAVLVPPATDEEIEYEISQPNIVFPQIGFGSCGLQSSYEFIYVSIMSWGFVPFQNSMRLLSPLIRYSARLPTNQYSVTPAYPYYPDPNSYGDTSGAFKVYLPFHESKMWGSFGGTLDVGTYVKVINRTMPSCSFYGDSFFNKCAYNRTRSPFTPTNVTYTMTDSTELCPPASVQETRMNSAQRRAGSSSTLQYGAIDDIITKYPFYDVIYFPSPEVTSFISIMMAGMAVGLVFFLRWDYLDFNRASMFLSNRKLFSNKLSKFKDENAQLLFGVEGVINSLGSKLIEEDSLVDIYRASSEASPKDDSFGTIDNKQEMSIDLSLDNSRSSSHRHLDISKFTVDLDHDNLEDLRLDVNSSHHSLSYEFEEQKDDDVSVTKFIVDLKGSPFVEDLDNSVTEIDTEVESTVSENGPRKDLHDFFQQAVHLSNFVAKVSDPYVRAIFSLAESHEIWRMFTPWRSFVRTRAADYLNIFSRTLLCMLFATAFYDILYPADYSCERRIYSPYIQANETQKHACLSASAPFSFLDKGLGTECVWNLRPQKSSTCTRQVPPDYFMFYYFAALLISFVAIMPGQIVKNLLKRVCDKRPRLEDIGLDSQYWLGAPLTFTISSTDPDLKHLTALGSLFHKDYHDTILGKKSGNLPKHATAQSSTLFASPIPRNAPKEVDLSEDIGVLTRCKYAYYDFTTAEDEAIQLLHKLQTFLCEHIVLEDSAWIDTGSNRLLLTRNEVVLESLNIQLDGKPLGGLDINSAQTIISRKLKSARIASRGIVTDVTSRQGTVNLHDDIQDMRLVQHLILEQLEPVRRFAVRRAFTQANEEAIVLSSDENQHYVGFFEWASIWFALLISWGFAFAWIYKWAIVSNQIAVNAWFITFSIAFVQDMFVFMTVESVFVFNYGIELARSQLKQVKSNLTEIASHKMNAKLSSKVDCDDVRLVHHFSAACRAARTSALSHLPSSQLLMRLDDFDIAKIRECATFESPSKVAAIFAEFLDGIPWPWLQNVILNLTIQMIWTMFISAWYMFHRTQRVAFYVLLGVFIGAIVLYALCEVLKFARVLPESISKAVYEKVVGPTALQVDEVWRQTMKVVVDSESDDDYDNFFTALKLRHQHHCKARYRDLIFLPFTIVEKKSILRFPTCIFALRPKISTLDPTGNRAVEERLLQQYIGGSTSDLLKLHLLTTARKLKSSSVLSKVFSIDDATICDVDTARAFVGSIFDVECAQNGSMSLKKPALVGISAQLWRTFSVDGAFLTAREWDTAMAFLLNELDKHPSASLFKAEYLEFIRDYIKHIQLEREKDIRAVALRQLPPPAIGPLPIPLTNFGEFSTADLELTFDLRMALRRVKSRFQQMDVFNSSTLSLHELLRLCTWIWSFYHPGGVELTDDQRNEMNQMLFRNTRSRAFMSLFEVTDWLVSCDESLSRDRANLHRAQAQMSSFTPVVPESPLPIPAFTNEVSTVISANERLIGRRFRKNSNSSSSSSSSSSDSDYEGRGCVARIKLPSFFDEAPDIPIRYSNGNGILARMLPKALPWQPSSVASEFTVPAQPGTRVIRSSVLRGMQHDSGGDSSAELELCSEGPISLRRISAEDFKLTLSDSESEDEGFSAATESRDAFEISVMRVNLCLDSDSEDGDSSRVELAVDLALDSDSDATNSTVSSVFVRPVFSRPKSSTTGAAFTNPVATLQPVDLDSSEESD